MVKKIKLKKDGTPSHQGENNSKLTDRFIKAAEKIILSEHNAIILTDEELLVEINDLLEEKEKIHSKTLVNWKTKLKTDEKELDEMGRRFCFLIKKALANQKKDLFKKLENDKQAWQRWAWIIERKFDDWNIRHRTDLTSGGQPLPLLGGQSNDKKNDSDRKVAETE